MGERSRVGSVNTVNGRVSLAGEVVVDGETGVLVPVKQLPVAPFEPEDPEAFSKDLAAGINRLLSEPQLRTEMAQKGQARARELFSWSSIAQQTVDLYSSLIQS